METTEKKTPWYRSWKWGFLQPKGGGNWIQGRVSWYVRGLIAFALMLVGSAKYMLSTQYALKHSTFVWVLLAGTVLVYGAFCRAVGNDPGCAYLSIRGRRRWHEYLLGNLAIIAICVIAVNKEWLGAWVGARDEELIAWWVTHIEGIDTVGAVLLWALGVIGGIALGVRGVVSTIRWWRATFVRREPYEQELRELRRTLEDEQRAHRRLREIVPMVGQCLATGIVRIRLSKNQPKSVQTDLLVNARMVLENAFHVLIHDATTRDAMLERSRRTAEGEDEAQPSASTTPPQA